MLWFVVVTFFIHHTSRKNMLVQTKILGSACKNLGRSGNRKQTFFFLRLTQFVSEQSREHARASRYSGNVQEIHTTGCATSHLHGGCTTGSRSDGTTTIGHSLATRSLCENVRADKSYPVTKRLVAY